MSETRRIEIRVPALARVEGEGALDIVVENGAITELKLRIYEPPRFFEKLLEGRGCDEVLDIVARICGICPVAYQMSAVQALESILGIEPSPWVRDMRRVFYCGEWLESHGLHVHMLAAPDFLGYGSAIEMARAYPEEVRRGLRLQALGNEIVKLFGARSVHPVGACIGGFFAAPAPAAVAKLVIKLREALPEAQELVRWTAGLPLPDIEQDFISVALRAGDEYPMYTGRIVSSDGLDIEAGEFDLHLREHQVPHSTALHCLLHGRPYLVGPLARMNLNHDLLPEPIRRVLSDANVVFPSRNMFHSIIARAAEIYTAIHEALRLLEAYALPDASRVHATPRAGRGFGATEAPRGLLWHCYELDHDGRVLSARIVPPTSQNQARAEEDLRSSLNATGFSGSDGDIKLLSEKVVRNYDPCISCSTHFLDVRVRRE